MTEYTQNICRICEKNSNNLIDVSKLKYQTLVDKYLSCTKCTFDVHDKLPKFFCDMCIEILNISHNFKEQCEQTYNKLLVLFHSIDVSDTDKIKEEISNSDDDDGNHPNDGSDDFYQNLFDFETSKQEVKKEFTISTNKTKDIIVSHTNVKKKKTSSFKTYECYICSQTYKCKSKQAIMVHMQSKHNFGKSNEIRVFNCDKCDKVLSSQATLKRHQKLHVPNKNDQSKSEIPCENCGKLFSTPANKRRHIRDVHLQRKPFECEICHERFSRSTVLHVHMQKHSDERNFKCDKCEKAFKSQIALNDHSFRHLSKEEQINSPLYRYKRQIYIRSMQICEICGKSMKYQQMFYHMKKHHYGCEKIHECLVCLKKFAHKNDLVIHNYIHTGERPHKCELCPKAFRQWGHLSEHRKTHTGDKPNKCRFCEKAFALRGNLHEHERIHTGETPYSCNLCPHRFANSKALKRHAKNLHPENEADAITLKTKGELLKGSRQQ